MPARSQLRRQVLVDRQVDLGDISVVFRFDRNIVTDAWLGEWGRLEEERNLGAINDALASLIVAWDITEDDGTSVPVTAEQISSLFTLSDKSLIVQELLLAARPADDEGKGLSAPTPMPPTASTQPQPTPPNGTQPSPSQAPLASPSPT